MLAIAQGIFDIERVNFTASGDAPGGSINSPVMQNDQFGYQGGEMAEAQDLKLEH
ncbi:MAG TPA: hypothetical protein VNX46_11220 [Candidatus Acidoferrum sp.]|nr:hypothetical protein [Candidatus Acidoferrum sp.]